MSYGQGYNTYTEEIVQRKDDFEETIVACIPRSYISIHFCSLGVSK
jgi:hypothetical protein